MQVRLRDQRALVVPRLPRLFGVFARADFLPPGGMLAAKVTRCSKESWHALYPRTEQACLDDSQASGSNSDNRVLRIIKVLRMLKILRLLRAVKVVE